MKVSNEYPHFDTPATSTRHLNSHFEKIRHSDKNLVSKWRVCRSEETRKKG